MSERSASPCSDKNFSSNRRKRISKNRLDQSQKISESGQSKLTHFFKHIQKRQKCNPNPQQRLKTQLQVQLEKLRQIQQNLTTQKQQIYQQQTNSKKQYDVWLRKSRAIVQECISEVYANKRMMKSLVNPQIGFYSMNLRTFNHGNFGVECQQKKNRLESLLENNQIIDEDQRQMVQQLLQNQYEQYKFYKKQLNKYKQRQKISNQQKRCKFTNQWPLLLNKYQVLQLIGKGGFSQVYKAYDIEENKYVAIKMSSTSGIKSQLNHYIIRQYQNHLKLQHPNIAKMYQVVQTTNTGVCIALQYCDGPELSSYISQHGRVPQQKARYIIRQVLQALNYLSTLNPKIIHYDLKPQNIMFSKGRVKILDFGLSRQIDSQHSRIALSNQGIGTYWYLPPESFNQKNPEISQKVDIWSAGVILYEMLVGRKPFGHNKSQSTIFKEGIILEANQVEFPHDIQISDHAKSLIEGCLAYNYNKRFTPEQALSHQFFK